MTDFADELRRITESYCVLKGIEIKRRYSDEELAPAMAEVVLAIVEEKARRTE